jgi:hypothetical protein
VITHALSDGTDLYWPYSIANVEMPDSPVISPVIFDSPMVVGVLPPNTPMDFAMMEGCGVSPNNNLCGDEFYRFNDNFSVDGDTRSITTNLGIFTNPIELGFRGGNTPRGNFALSILGDIRGACGSSNEQIEHNGNMFVVTEIGIIQITNLCTILAGNGDNVSYSMTIRNTNIALP